MPEPIYITSSCAISKNIAYKDSLPLYENKEISGVAEFLNSLYKHLEQMYPKFYKMDNLSKLGFLASEILIHPTVQLEKYDAYEIGVVITNAQSSLDNDYKYLKTMKDNASPSLFVYTLPNILIGEICIRNKIKGENACFIFEAFNPDFLEKYVESLFNNNNLQACICGWVDLLNEDYKAVLYYIEKDKSDNAIPFTKENINTLYQITNG